MGKKLENGKGAKLYICRDLAIKYQEEQVMVAQEHEHIADEKIRDGERKEIRKILEVKNRRSLGKKREETNKTFR